MGVQQHWSLSAGANQTADPTINLREGMAPSQINDSARQMMAKVKAMLLDTSGVLATTGTDTAYELTTNEVFTSLVDGMVLAFRPHVDSAADPTLEVDGLAAKPIRVTTGVDAPAGMLKSGLAVRVVYDAGSDEFLLADMGKLDAPAGTRMVFAQASAPLGWVKETGTSYNNAALRLVTGTGAGTGGSSAFTDVFTARTISQANLPNVNLTAQSEGSHNHGGLTTPGGAHTHGLTNGAAVYSNGGGFDLQDTGSGPVFSVTNIAAVGDHQHGINSDGSHTHTVPLGGSGTPLDFAVKYVDMIVCEKA